MECASSSKGERNDNEISLLSIFSHKQKSLKHLFLIFL